MRFLSCVLIIRDDSWLLEKNAIETTAYKLSNGLSCHPFFYYVQIPIC